MQLKMFYQPPYSIAYTIIVIYFPGVSDMAILVTDGASLKVSDTNVSALNLRNAGVRIVVVGVESDPPLTELRNIASDPDSQNVFVTDSFDNMGNISIAIRNLFRGE